MYQVPAGLLPPRCSHVACGTTCAQALGSYLQLLLSLFTNLNNHEVDAIDISNVVHTRRVLVREGKTVDGRRWLSMPTGPNALLARSRLISLSHAHEKGTAPALLHFQYMHAPLACCHLVPTGSARRVIRFALLLCV